MQQSLVGRRVTVMGLGTFGAGLASVRFLVDSGAEVTVTDLRSPPQLADSLEQISDLPGVRLHLGGHQDADFRDTDLLLVSPSVRPNNPCLALARQHGVPLTSEIRLFWERCRAPIVGVTGSNGKSSTATLIRDMLAADGRRTWLGGNIGRSLLTDVEQIARDHWVVLELSSFQLADLDADRRSPQIAVITNFTPNHLDWHGTFADYAQAKQTILRWQQPGDLVVRHAGRIESDWPAVGRSVVCSDQKHPDALVFREGTCLVFPPDADTLDLSTCDGLAGDHLWSAALLAATTARALQVAPAAISTALREFTGLPHRLERVGHWRDRTFINDSASTTPESTIAALHAITTPVVLITGGADKGCDCRALIESIVQRARTVITLGDVRQKLAAAVQADLLRLQQDSPTVPLESISVGDSLPEAFATACELSRTGETILFSPGFASGTMFRNYDDRGRVYCELVNSIPSTG